MALRASLMVLILLFLTSSAGWSNTILFYVLSTRNDSTGCYNGPEDADILVMRVERDGHSVDVEDKTTLQELTLDVLLKYDQAWVLEGDDDNAVEVSDGEAKALYRYYQQGHVVWISSSEGNMEWGSDWSEDARVFMNEFGVDAEDRVIGPRAPNVKGDDPLLDGIRTLVFDGRQGGLIIENPDVRSVWQYPADAGKKDAIAVLDKKGYAVFDSGWVLGYTYYRPQARNDDNIQFALNVARVKTGFAVSPAARLIITWARVKAQR